MHTGGRASHFTMRSVGLHVGIYDHFGWAVAVTASSDHEVVDRRRIDLLEPGVPNAPIHHPGQGLSLAEVEALVARVRASAERATAASLDALSAALPGTITSVHLRAVPADFPADIAVQLRPPYEARADAIMYRQVFAAIARARGWAQPWPRQSLPARRPAREAPMRAAAHGLHVQPNIPE